ncbi:hypothetical protein [Candidatus Odyssella thessalonicensis]|nr:hypothetical protein [Candidatus Odyssella thessalonicensis]
MKAYRLDIEGLRALSILLVIFFMHSLADCQVVLLVSTFSL